MHRACKNCDAQLSGNYCSDCGQRAKIGPITFSELRSDLSQSLFSVESPLATTFKTLISKPEKLFTDYLQGGRKKYYRPIAFFILMTALYLLVRSLIGFEANMETIVSVDDESSELQQDATIFMIRNINKFLFILVLGLGLSMKLLFYKKLRLIEYWVIAFYFTGIYTLLTIFGTVITVYGSKQFQPYIIILALLYFIYCCLRFFDGNKIIIAFKSFLAFLLGMLIYVAGSFELSYLIVAYLL